MAKNNKDAAKPTESKSTAGGAGVKAKKKLGGSEIFLIIFAAVALVAIVASVIIGVVMNSNKNYRVDYFNDNLSKYLTISKDAYTDITVEVSGVDPVQDFDVENAILQALCANKSKEPLYNGIYMKNQTLSAGDVVYIYYRGYTVDDDGNRTYFDGGCNFSSDASELELGSGGFVPGFELNLIGKNAKDYSTFNRIESVGTIGENDKIFISYVRELNDGSTSGTICAVVDLSLGKDALDEQYGTLFYGSVVGKQYGSVNDIYVETDNGGETFKNVQIYRATGEDDVIQLTYSAYYFDGAVVAAKSTIIDLSDPTVDETFGEGFRDFFISGVPIGTKALNESGKAATLNTQAGENELNAFYDMTVSYVYDIGDNPLTVEAYFPLSYQEATLQGKTAYFDVYIQKAQIFETPEYNDAFITDTLKLTAEDLAEYEGDTLTDKYTAKIREGLEEEYQSNLTTAVENELWKVFMANVNVKSLPETDVRDYYDGYYNDILTQYSSYSSYYDSIDAFAREYLGLSSTADWNAALTSMAQDSVTQKLVFYYILRDNEGYMLSDDEIREQALVRADEYFETYLANVGCSRDKYDTEEKYEEAVASYRASYNTYYNEEYFSETVVYEHGFEKLRERVTVVIK